MAAPWSTVPGITSRAPRAPPGRARSRRVDVPSCIQRCSEVRSTVHPALSIPLETAVRNSVRPVVASRPTRPPGRASRQARPRVPGATSSRVAQCATVSTRTTPSENSTGSPCRPPTSVCQRSSPSTRSNAKTSPSSVPSAVGRAAAMKTVRPSVAGAPEGSRGVRS